MALPNPLFMQPILILNMLSWQAMVMGLLIYEQTKCSMNGILCQPLASPNFTSKFAKAYYVNKNSKCLKESFVATTAPSSKKGVQAPLLPRKKTTLAKEIVDLTATENGKKAVLTWKASPEESWETMEVQRSANGNDFTTIGTVHVNSLSNSQLYNLQIKIPDLFITTGLHSNR